LTFSIEFGIIIGHIEKQEKFFKCLRTTNVEYVPDNEYICSCIEAETKKE